MRALVLAFVLLAASASAQTTHTVVVNNFSFTPATLTVQSGDTVEWVNQGGFHNVNQLSGSQSFGNAAASAPWTYRFTFTEIGTSTYDCEVHPAQMQGAVTVTSNTSSETPAASGADLTLAGANPFTDAARFTLSLTSPEAVRAVVYDARGREVAMLFDGVASIGNTNLEWAAGEARAGIYVVRVTGESVQLSQGVARAGKVPAAHH